MARSLDKIIKVATESYSAADYESRYAMSLNCWYHAFRWILIVRSVLTINSLHSAQYLEKPSDEK